MMPQKRQAGEGEGDGHRRKRRRRRRGPREPRDGAAPREEGEPVRVARRSRRRRGRRGRRSRRGRRRRTARRGPRRSACQWRATPAPPRPSRRTPPRGGELEDGLVGSIADELGPTPVSEVTSAVADFDGGGSEPAPSLVQAERFADRSRSQRRCSLRPTPSPSRSSAHPRRQLKKPRKRPSAPRRGGGRPCARRSAS